MIFEVLQGIALFQDVPASTASNFLQRAIPLTTKKLNISTTNGYMPSISIYLFNILSTTNGSMPPIPIYLLNILSTTNGSMPLIPIVLHHQTQYPISRTSG